MESIGVVGLNSRNSSAAALAQFTIAKERIDERLPGLAVEIGVREVIYLATCNRVEIAFRGDGETSVGEYRRRVLGALAGRRAQPGEAARTFRAWAGEGAAEHIFLVASGLDSAQLGEQEIRVQVRDALRAARAAGCSGTLLDQIFTEALRVASLVHRNVAASGRRGSLADLALEHIQDRLRQTPGPVALVGISPMTRHCALSLAAENTPLVVVNRTPAAAEELAAEVGGEARALQAFRDQPAGVEAMIVATGADEALFGRPELERLAARAPSGQPPLVVDMAIPANVDPQAAQVVGLPRIGMDEITAEASGDRDQRLVELAPARELIDESLESLRRDLAEKMMSPVIANLNQRYRQTVAEGLERLFRKELRDVPDEDRQVIARWAEVLARRFAHIPTKGLRGLAAEFGAPAVRTFLDASGENLFPDEPFHAARPTDDNSLEA